jgi:hypothetical protein
MPVPTYLMKTTVQCLVGLEPAQIFVKRAIPTLIFVQYFEFLTRGLALLVAQRMENIATIESWIKITSNSTS